MTRSGSPNVQPGVYFGSGGKSASLPFGAPASTQATIVALSFSLFQLSATVAGSLRRSPSQILIVERVIKIPDHHLIPGLRPPFDQLRWIGIELVPARIVVVRDANQPAAFGRGHRLF